MEDLPQDLAGYQNVLCGSILNGDIIVEPITREKQWAGSSVGRDIIDCGFDVYRKMAVPKQGDHDKGWQQIRAENAVPIAHLKAKTYDDGKPPLANLPWAGVREVAMVQLYGHSKYQDFNNFRKGMEISRNLSCAVRHISEFMEGQDLDKESGRNHLAHACCRLLFVLQNLHDGVAIDDRYKKTNKPNG